MLATLAILFLTTTAINNIQGFQIRSNMEPLQGEETIGTSDKRTSQMDLEQRKAVLESIKDNLHNFVLGIASSAQSKYPKIEDSFMTKTPSPALHEAFRETLYARGMPKAEVEEILQEVEDRIRSGLSRHRKRGWNRFSVQTRFAPFGTKLVPNRKLENGGATLLRYGRSASTH